MRRHVSHRTGRMTALSCVVVCARKGRCEEEYGKFAIHGWNCCRVPLYDEGLHDGRCKTYRAVCRNTSHSRDSYAQQRCMARARENWPDQGAVAAFVLAAYSTMTVNHASCAHKSSSIRACPLAAPANSNPDAVRHLCKFCQRSSLLLRSMTPLPAQECTFRDLHRINHRMTVH